MPIPRLYSPTFRSFETREAWLDARMQTIGASESAALIERVSKEMGVPADEDGELDAEDLHGEIVSPYATPYSLWMLKTGRLKPHLPKPGRRIDWGNRLEPVIAASISESQGWAIRKPDGMFYHPEVERMTATLDYEVLLPNTPGAGPAESEWVPFEIKNVAGTEIKKWKGPSGFGDWEIPGHIRVQVQHQMAVVGARRAVVGVLFSGSDERFFVEERDEAFIEEIRSAVESMLSAIDADREPEPDYLRDGWILRKIFAATDEAAPILDWSKDEEIQAKINLWKDKSDASNKLKTESNVLRDEILHKIKGNPAALIGNGLMLTAKTTSGSEFMVKREAFRTLRLARVPRKKT